MFKKLRNFLKKWWEKEKKTLRKKYQGYWKKILSVKHLRFCVIVAIFPLQVLLFFCFRGLWESIFHFSGEVRLATLIPLLIAAPYALFIWYWRDMAKRADIETARADLLQKEFHQIEQWATEQGAMLQLSDTPPVAGTSAIKPGGILQVAAIHQLHPYATGVNGKVFQKPASEIYKALLSAWGEEIKDKSEKYLQKRGERPTPPPHIKAIHKIVEKDWRKFPDDFLPWIYLGFANLHGADLARAPLFIANLMGANLAFADLREAFLGGAFLGGVQLYCAKLQGADLQGADLRADGLEEAELEQAKYSKGSEGYYETKFPKGFDPGEHGMVRVEDDE